jgi:hypothetical protein
MIYDKYSNRSNSNDVFELLNPMLTFHLFRYQTTQSLCNGIGQLNTQTKVDIAV